MEKSFESLIRKLSASSGKTLKEGFLIIQGGRTLYDDSSSTNSFDALCPTNSNCPTNSSNCANCQTNCANCYDCNPWRPQNSVHFYHFIKTTNRMKQKLQQLLEQLGQEGGAAFSGGFSMIRGGVRQNNYQCTNSGTSCSANNTGSCTNQNNCNDTSNPNVCNNYGICLI